MTEKRNGIIQTYYYEINIRLWYGYFTFNGKREGEYKEYYNNGQLCMICNYKNNKIEGECKEYYKNGKLELMHNYKNDKINIKMIKKKGNIKNIIKMEN